MIAIQPSPSVDDTALLSTLVQSGAALVAIIAGLLVARLVALVGERVSLERRVQELEVTREERRKDLEVARQDSLDYDGDDFIGGILELYFEDPSRSFESLYEEYGLDRRDSAEIRPYFDSFVERVKETWAELDIQARGQGERPKNWKSQRLQLLSPYAPGSRGREIAEQCLELLEHKWAEGEPDTSLPWYALPNVGLIQNAEIRAASLTIESNYQRDLRRDEDAADIALRDVELELKHAHRALQMTSKPQGLIVATLVLAGIATAGMVLPLLQMTFGRASLSMGMRVLYVGLFVASLVVFFVYLAFEMRRVMRRPRIGHSSSVGSS